MALHNKKSSAMLHLLNQLERDRSWLLEQIDRGNWPKYRSELAELERELGQLLTRALECMDE